MTTLAIDPGTNESAFVLWDGARILDAQIIENSALLASFYFPVRADVVAVEMIASYGMPVGKEVFETVLWIGRIIERCSIEARLIYRRDVKLHHCQSPRAKDANVRQALIDKYGAPGTKKEPGITYGLKSHLWAAFAIATYVSETKQERIAA